MFDQIVVGVCCQVLRNALEPVEQVACIDLDKTVDTNVADVCLIVVEAIAYIAVLLDVLTAGALWLLAFTLFTLTYWPVFWGPRVPRAPAGRPPS